MCYDFNQIQLLLLYLHFGSDLIADGLIRVQQPTWLEVRPEL